MFRLLRSGVTRTLGTTLLVVCGAVVIGSVVLGALWIISAPGGSRYGFVLPQPIGPLPAKASLPHIAFPGVAFRPGIKGSDATGWAISYVLVSKDTTLVVSTHPRPTSQITGGRSQPTLTLTDNHGRLYQGHSSDNDLVMPPCGDATPATRVYQIFAFAPLLQGTTRVWIHHAVPRGGTMAVPINLAPLAALPRPSQAPVTRRSGRVRVTLTMVIRGAVFSEADLYAHGFAPYRGNGAPQAPPRQEPGRVTIRTVSGQDLAMCVVVMPADEGAATAEVGFRTPPRGTTVTITVDDYILRDLALNPHTHGHWAFTFSMP